MQSVALHYFSGITGESLAAPPTVGLRACSETIPSRMVDRDGWAYFSHSRALSRLAGFGPPRRFTAPLSRLVRQPPPAATGPNLTSAY